MIETILLDAGGVLVYPLTGLWLRPRVFHEIMDKYLAGVGGEEHARARRAAALAMPESDHMYTEDLECEHMRELYSICYRRELGLPVTDADIAALAISHTYDSDRYALYGDVLPTLRRWAGRYRVALVSDTLPSLRRALSAHGVLPFLEVTSLSCDNGVLKPDPRMFEKALAELGVPAETAVFADDMDRNLLGARRLGIKAVKMLRPFYMEDTAQVVGDWDGPVARSLEEMEALLPTL